MTSSRPDRVFDMDGPQALHDRAGTAAIEAARAATLPLHTLMQRAGHAVARLALARAPHASRIVVAVGAGNNGGDGFVAARWMHAWGKDVTVWMVGDDGATPADAAHARDAAHRAGVKIKSRNDIGALFTLRRKASHEAPGMMAADLWIDALLGIGATRAPVGLMVEVIGHMNDQRTAGAHVIAVDVPSGLDSDVGQAFGEAAVEADTTLSLLTLKPGLFTATGRDHVGDVWFDGLMRTSDGPAAAGAEPFAWLSGTGALRASSTRRHAEHKGSFGDVAIVGGDVGMLGAALLAARAALAAGPGRVFLNALDPSFHIDATRPELMCRPDWWREAAREALGTATVVCGCGGGEAVRTTMPRLMSLAGRLVLDADALNAIGRDSGFQAALIGRETRRLATVITPHPLEAARLLGIDTATVQRDRIAAAQRLAARYRCVVVLKGSGTVIAAPDVRPRINATGNASLAAAGTGDALAGWIGGRWSSHGGEQTPETLVELVASAVAEHGRAAEPLRPGSLRAADLVEALHAIARDA